MLQAENSIKGQVTVSKVQKPKKKKKQKQKDDVRSFIGWNPSKPQVARIFKAPKQKPQLPLFPQKKTSPDYDLRNELAKQLITSHWLRKR